jgi:hypothetical protein
MITFDFKLVLDQAEIDEAGADALYAHCKDGTLVTAGGVTYLDFDREAHSLEEAVRSAIADIHAAGFRATRVEIDACTFSPQQV